MTKFKPTLRRVPTSLAVVGALCLSLACDTGEPDTLERAAALDPAAELEAFDGLDADPAIALTELSLAEQIAALEPRKTRAGWLRFTDPAINNPEAAPLLLARLDAGEDSPAVRAAVAEAISRTGADYAAEVAARIPGESNPRVRELLVGNLGHRADSPAAHPGLVAGLQDSEATVRSAAARALASRSDGAAFSDSLLGLLSDDDAAVRADAARTLGVLHVGAATEGLTTLLDDPNANVRLDSLRALSRIDPAYAAGLDLARFATDEDSRVSRLAITLQ